MGAFRALEGLRLGVVASHTPHSISLPKSVDMRVVLQRVSAASVRVGNDVVSSIGNGLCLLVGISEDDTIGDVEAAVAKIATLRVFADSEERMNLSLEDVGGEILLVSQFTLYGEVRRGRRPSFTRAAASDLAAPLIEQMASLFRERGLAVAEGVFGARMEVELVNDGPVTLALEINGGVVS